MRRRQSSWAGPVAAGVAVALGAAGLVLAQSRGTADTLVPTTTAPATDGAAYTREAIENLRVLERFRFTQTVAGVGGAADPGSGSVTAEVDLARNPSDKPRYHSRAQLRAPDGRLVNLDTIAVDADLHVRKPTQTAYARSEKRQARREGKPPGGGPDTVGVVDPVMFILEPVDALPDTAFGTPSAVTDGRRTVVVDIPGEATLTLSVVDSTRLVDGIVYAKGASSASFTLADHGSSDITIEDP